MFTSNLRIRGVRMVQNYHVSEFMSIVYHRGAKSSGAGMHKRCLLVDQEFSIIWGI